MKIRVLPVEVFPVLTVQMNVPDGGATVEVPEEIVRKFENAALDAEKAKSLLINYLRQTRQPVPRIYLTMKDIEDGVPASD